MDLLEGKFVYIQPSACALNAIPSGRSPPPPLCRALFFLYYARHLYLPGCTALIWGASKTKTPAAAAASAAKTGVKHMESLVSAEDCCELQHNEALTTRSSKDRQHLLQSACLLNDNGPKIWVLMRRSGRLLRFATHVDAARAPRQPHMQA